MIQGRHSWGLGGHDPRQLVVNPGVAGESQGGREILVVVQVRLFWDKPQIEVLLFVHTSNR